ncbi:MAG: DNA-protecting protein DprA [Saprospiraceae bacterium]|nr:DNA-protecting protein DprA [Saprospiraceae bacterium]
MDDLLYQIALTQAPLVGSVTARNLVSYCGSAREVFQANKKELLKIPGIGERTVQAILQRDYFKAAEDEILFIEKHGIEPLFYLDKKYPERLRHFPDSPVMLYCKGNIDLNAPRTIGIVGTRQPTVHGIGICEELVESLADYKVVIVSGLALGIDAVAHRKSLQTGQPTLGVLGHGLAQIYPYRHKQLAAQMIEQGGGILSELGHRAGPEREHFPMRNRIIAGLSDAIIVVETALQGGSVITVNFANEYNKDVFAVPGRLKDKFSQGCNHLIKTHKAALIENASDIAYTMRWTESGAKKGFQQELFVELSEPEKTVVALLGRQEAMSIDQLTFEMRVTNSEMATLLLELEFKGMVAALPGKRYVLA